MGKNNKKFAKKLEPYWSSIKKDFMNVNNLSEFILETKKTKEEAEEYIEGLNNYASNLKNKGLTTSQLRNIFSRVKNLSKEKIGELPMLKVQLAYTASRNTENIRDKNKKKTIENFYLLLIALIDKVDENNLEEYKKFMESIIALHKFQGGK